MTQDQRRKYGWLWDAETDEPVGEPLAAQLVEDYDGYHWMGDYVQGWHEMTEQQQEQTITDFSAWVSGLQPNLRLRVIAALVRSPGNAYTSRG